MQPVQAHVIASGAVHVGIGDAVCDGEATARPQHARGLAERATNIDAISTARRARRLASLTWVD
jgi:hypothetical protein